MLSRKMSRRGAISVTAKIAAGAVAAGVVAGVAGYFAGTATAAPPVTITETRIVPTTVR
ncbi:MAG: hypothetical protein ABDH32_03185 [Candidatus Caldarchaeales archaeon]